MVGYIPFALVILIKAQEMWGITTSNYAGSTGVLLNPTSITTSKLYQDVNIAAIDIFFENNYAYHPSERLFPCQTDHPEFNFTKIWPRRAAF